MAKDVFTALGRCTYCGRPATTRWPGGVASCNHEVCAGLAFAESRRHPAPVRQRRRYLRAPR